MKIDEKLIEDLFWDDEDGYSYLPRIKGFPKKQGNNPKGNSPKSSPMVMTSIQEQIDNLREYKFTYEASRHEKGWLLDSLGPFFDEQWFDDVLRVIKGGKEASVYLCKANSSASIEFIAVKVYRPRSLRNLRNDHLYREGRAQLDADGLEIVDSRMSRALKKRTAFVQETMHTSWIEHEFRSLKLLHEAGCDVPTPYASDHNAILMDFIGDEQMAAPTLNGVHLEPGEARMLFERVIHNLDLMLA